MRGADYARQEITGQARLEKEEKPNGEIYSLGLPSKPGNWRKAKKARRPSTKIHLAPPSASQDNWHRGSYFPRKARFLAEGQKSADGKHKLGISTPLPPTHTVGGEGRISREKGRCLPISGLIWRSVSNFPRKMQFFGYLASDACGCARRGRISYHFFFVSSTGSKITVTGVPSGGMRSVNASNSNSALFLELLICKSSMAPSKLETQITSPAFAA